MKRKIRQSKSTNPEFKLPKMEMRWPSMDLKVWALLAVTLFMLLLNYVILSPAKKPAIQHLKASQSVKVSTAVRDVLAQFGVGDEHMTLQDSVTRVVIPADFSFFGFYDALRVELGRIGAEIIDCSVTKDGTLMAVGENNRIAEYLLLVKSRRVQSSRGQAAIIIDDFGYAYNKVARDFLTMDFPFTVSIIPGLSYSQKIAEIADVHNKEVLVHMPMEPLYEKFDDNGFTILTGQDPGKVSLRLRQAFALIPMAVGLNNHQGSKATADAQLMESVMQSLKGMNKYFVDSRTNEKSVAYAIARKAHLPSGQNYLFLDAKDDKAFIAAQLNRMARVAKDEQSVIVIGHVRKKTLAVLQEMLPKLKASGITFVPVSEVLN